MKPALSSTSLDNSLCPQVGLTTINRLWLRNVIIIWGQDNWLHGRKNRSQEVCHCLVSWANHIPSVCCLWDDEVRLNYLWDPSGPMTWFIGCLPQIPWDSYHKLFPKHGIRTLSRPTPGSLLQVELISHQGLMWGKRNSILMLYLWKTHFHMSTYICLCACAERYWCWQFLGEFKE